MTRDNEVIKYISHKIITKCSCGMMVKQGEATKNGKKYLCPHCGLQLRFNLESLNDTEVFAITVDKNKGFIIKSNYEDRDIDVEKLSSGEQNELIIFYNFL